MKKVVIWISVIVVLLAAAGGIGYHYWYQTSHIFVEDAVYAKDLTELDLRGTGVSLEHYESVRQQLPDCEIRYDLPFQGSFYPDDATELTVSSLTEEEVALLDYLPMLKAVHAEDCTDYDQLLALQARRPECYVSYRVTLFGEDYPEDTRELSFGSEKLDMQELHTALGYLPDVTSIYFEQPAVAAQELTRLREAWPEITVTWVKDAFGTTYTSDVTEIDLSGMLMDSLDVVEEAMAYFPALEKVVLCGCGPDAKTRFDNETMAAFREKMRPEYKVVWSMSIYGLTVRTDDTYFMPTKYGVEVHDYQMQQLVYCEDMLCVDVGHMPIRNISWVTGMPHLKYLIVADGPLVYIDALSTCKELVYLELFDTWVSDYTPLLGCTALEDLNVGDTKGDIMFFAQMPWLKNLWINRSGVTQREHDKLQALIPDTHLQTQHSWLTAMGWRELQNYFDMRELLGMPCYSW